jgi:peptidoglycan/xylan/chitin deacetylase (PgdA/CDA1 family)
MIVRTLKRTVKRTLASRPGWRLLGPVVREPGVIVLTYHRINGSDRRLDGISVEAFERHMKWVREHCNPIEPAEIEHHASRGRTARPPVVVSFDDGYKDYRELAYPVLQRLRIPAVVFIATSFMDEGGMVWTEAVQWATRYARKDRVKLPWSDEPAMSLDGAAARSKLSGAIRAHLKKLPDAERRAILPELLAALDAPPLPERQMLDWDDVRAAMEFTRWGGHTHTHPILSRLSRADAEREIKTCRDRIEAETGKAPTLFAYPNGKPADYTPETQAILRANGFTIAFSTSEGIAGPRTDWMAVPRLPSGEFDVPDFVWTASGLMRA